MTNIFCLFRNNKRFFTDYIQKFNIFYIFLTFKDIKNYICI